MSIRNLVTINFFLELFIVCFMSVDFPLSVSLDISKEEELSENVRGLLVLHDKALEGFKENDAIKKCLVWCC